VLKTIGLITYHYPHLKTEQILEQLLKKSYELRIFALPFTPRKPRETLFNHRPSQDNAVAPQVIAKKHNITYKICKKDTDIEPSCDIYLILGAGILSSECVADKKIINCHPGIIPSSRGLDSFKWALYGRKPLGITLHFVDNQIDAGKIISIIPTDVYSSDSIDMLAKRHYENEINCLVSFEHFLNNPQNPFADIKKDEAKKRMPLEKEKELIQSFSEYKKQFGR